MDEAIKHQNYLNLKILFLSMEPNQRPLYLLPQKKKRAIIPKLVSLTVLGVIFYLGVILNLSLLQVSPKAEDQTQLAALLILICCLILGTILASLKARKNYLFYRDRIVFGKKQILYQNISSIEVKKGFWDKLFKTYSLPLNKTFIIKNIPAVLNIADYVNSLVSYSLRYNGTG